MLMEPISPGEQAGVCVGVTCLSRTIQSLVAASDEVHPAFLGKGTLWQQGFYKAKPGAPNRRWSLRLAGTELA